MQLSNCYVFSDVSLVEAQPDDLFKYRYRPYTILKATEEARRPISEEELLSRLARCKHE